jgi:transposase-like protein
MRRAAQKQAAEREARRPVCTGCGAKFTDERWEATQITDWVKRKDTHPHLGDECKHGADAAQAAAADE